MGLASISENRVFQQNRSIVRVELTEKERGINIDAPLYSTSLSLYFSMDRQPIALCELVSVVFIPIRL